MLRNETENQRMDVVPVGNVAKISKFYSRDGVFCTSRHFKFSTSTFDS